MMQVKKPWGGYMSKSKSKMSKKKVVSYASHPLVPTENKVVSYASHTLVSAEKKAVNYASHTLVPTEKKVVSYASHPLVPAEKKYNLNSDKLDFSSLLCQKVDCFFR